jgi:hypothetical protein
VHAVLPRLGLLFFRPVRVMFSSASCAPSALNGTNNVSVEKAEL